MIRKYKLPRKKICLVEKTMHAKRPHTSAATQRADSVARKQRQDQIASSRMYLRPASALGVRTALPSDLFQQDDISKDDDFVRAQTPCMIQTPVLLVPDDVTEQVVQPEMHTSTKMQKVNDLQEMEQVISTLNHLRSATALRKKNSNAAFHVPAKSTKTPRQKLDERIRDLKSNTWKLDEFKARIRKQQREEAEHKDTSAASQFWQQQMEKYARGDYKPEQTKEASAQRQIKHQQLVEGALQKRFHMYVEQNHALEQKIVRKENISRQYLEHKQFQKQYRKEIESCSYLLPVVCATQHIIQLCSALEKKREEQQRLLEQRGAIVILTKHLVPIIKARRKRRVQKALQLLQKNFWIFYINFRIRRKTNAVIILLRFLRSSDKKPKVNNQVSYFLKRGMLQFFVLPLYSSRVAALYASHSTCKAKSARTSRCAVGPY